MLDLFRRQRRPVSLIAYGLITALSYLAAFTVYFDLSWRPGYGTVLMESLPLLVGVRLAAGYFAGLSMQRWRFVGTGDMRRLVASVAIGTIVFVLVTTVFTYDRILPTTVLLLEPLFTILLTGGLWLGYRSAFEELWRTDTDDAPVRNVVVVGAGEAGEALVRHMVIHPTGYRPVAFVDDDPFRLGTSIHGVKVLGSTDDLVEVTARTAAHEVVIAIPSADPAVMRQIVRVCDSTQLPYRVLPPIAEVFEGDISLKQLREVRIEDLLGRDPVELQLPELTRDLAGQTVLITGAAGSIGSELSRQVARHRPRRLVVLDQSETGLFYLELELRELAPDLEIAAVVADIVDAGALERTYAVYAPSRVFHAAAYKHVPMMESNAREALRNNVIGTWRVAAAAGRHRVEKFVLVSTDKAVQPVNIMGATKRAAELVVMELQNAYPDTVFGAVRFGNVLGSAGSVIPVFKRQLEEGKPLTVTHPDVTRYFMTIPEASQLVLQASLLPELRGRIAMLEMGEPVRILDLARTLVRLSGGGRADDSIVFTGLRPGEKLHEELVAPGERATPTAVPKVRILHPEAARSRGVVQRLPRWDRLLWLGETDPVVADLFRVVPERRRRMDPGSRRKTDAPENGNGGKPRPVDTLALNGFATNRTRGVEAIAAQASEIVPPAANGADDLDAVGGGRGSDASGVPFASEVRPTHRQAGTAGEIRP
jgi:FlaA1/EpsC-like NDP-sugar epimerase